MEGGIAVLHEVGLEGLVEGGLAFGNVLGFQFGEGVVEQGHGPAAFELALGVGFGIGGFAFELALGPVEIEGNGEGAAAAFSSSSSSSSHTVSAQVYASHAFKKFILGGKSIAVVIKGIEAVKQWQNLIGYVRS